MTCARFESDLVNLARRARGVEMPADRAAALDRHIHVCARCASRLDREQALSAGLRRLAEDTPGAPADPAAEQAMLAAFDERWSASQRPWERRYVRPMAAAAAVLAAAATLMLAVENRKHRAEPPTATSSVTRAVAPGPSEVPTPPPRPNPRPRPRARASEPTFVVWPGATDLPRFESGQLMRVAFPASVAVSLGLRPSRGVAVVQTDVLVGQDGYARAVRLVP
jgi:hypothetical protein